jgi:hypothetical protein
MLIDEIRAEFEEDYYYPTADVTVVLDEIIGTTRWAYIKRTVYRRGDEYVQATYREGATEMQEQEAEAEVIAVTPVDRTIIDYVKVES